MEVKLVLRPRSPEHRDRLRQAVFAGATGFLGFGLQDYLRRARHGYEKSRVLDHRRVAETLAHSSSPVDSDLPVERGTAQDWFVTTGIIDPLSSPAEMYRVNVDLPLRIFERLERTSERGTTRLITFGSILENRPDIAASNPYIGSKAELLREWKAVGKDSKVAWIHFQLHTLYGGVRPPHPFLFAGQMYSALKSRTPFGMSAGTQLREYHHTDDIARSAFAFLADNFRSQLVDFSSGRPVRLRDLASGVFAHFGATHLLQIGVEPSAIADIFENVNQPSPALIAYRNSCEGITAWFEHLGISP